MKNILFVVFLFLLFSNTLVAQHIRSCTEMPVAHAPLMQQNDLPFGVKRAVSYKPNMGYYWKNGSTVRVKFLGGSSAIRKRVKYYANMWTQYANINFQFVESGAADIRVSFTQNGSSWSVIGKQATYLSPSKPTMNFGWFTERTPEYEFKRTVLHEFGHALGLLHEHQNPTGGIPWNKEVVYDYYRKTQGWNSQTTYQNVIQKAKREETQFSNYDPESIMHYPVSAKLTNGRYEVGMNQTLSPIDVNFIASIYPGRTRRPSKETSTTTTDRPKPSGNSSSTDRTERPRPSSKAAYPVKIRSSLGENQKEEVVYLYVAGRKHVLRLSKNGRTQKILQLRLPKGSHNYRLATATVYHGYKKVWNGRRYVRKYIEKTIRGSGSGNIQVNGGEQFAIYGNYDRNTKKMNVYLK